MSRPCLLDCDMGSDVDDALCLALALASPELELVGITCVGRESRLRAQISARLLELAGRTKIPVYAGCRVPILGRGGFNWMGHEGEGILEPDDDPYFEDRHAVDAIEVLSRAHEGLEIVAVGPMTNLAVALARDPDLVSRVSRLTIMGGHLRRVEYGGQVLPYGVDYNLCSDPYASLSVLRAGFPTRLVTADVTLQTWLRDEDVAALEATGHPLHAAIARAVRLWTPIQRRLFGQAGCDMSGDNAAFLHDPLTWACACDESFCTFEDLEVETTIDERGVLRTLECSEVGDETFPMRCATGLDAPRVRSYYMERVLSLA